MTDASSLHQLTVLYIGGMLIMAFISPIVSLISQIVAVIVIRKAQAWWAARKAPDNAVHTDAADITGNLP